MEWKLVPLRHFFPLKVVSLIEVLLYHIPPRLPEPDRKGKLLSVSFTQAPSIDLAFQFPLSAHQWTSGPKTNGIENKCFGGLGFLSGEDSFQKRAGVQLLCLLKLTLTHQNLPAPPYR
jgi:hypothetical protein